jgi:hypothetical protein
LGNRGNRFEEEFYCIIKGWGNGFSLSLRTNIVPEFFDFKKPVVREKELEMPVL